MQTTKFYSLFSGIFFLFFGYGLFLNSAGVKLAEMGVNDVIIGFLNAAFFVGAALSAVFAHRIVSSVGHIRSFSVFGAIFAIAALSHMMVDDLWVWGVLRIVLGFCHYSLLLLVESWMSEKTNVETRGRVLATYNIIFYLAFILGVSLLSLELTSNNIFTLATILVVMSMIPIALTKMKQPEIPERERISIPHFLAVSPLALATSFISGMLVNGFFTMVSVFMLKLDFSLGEISVYLMISMVGGFVSQLPVAGLSDRFGRRNTILFCSLIASVTAVIGIVAVFRQHSPYWLQYVVAFLFGCSLFTLYALSIARANDELPNNMSTVEVSRSLLFCYGIGALTAPPLLGMAIGVSEQYGFYSFFGLFSLILLGFAIATKPIPRAHRVEMQLSTPMATATTVDEIETSEETLVPFDEELVQEYQEHLETLDAESTEEEKEPAAGEEKEKESMKEENESIEEDDLK
ncbi:MFS transporter [Actinobacillus succinogenes]|uniref:Major facilitator superfamily MFS_1 n=1 Tax=Actinobacillus succinogenes (strain ATCC 55618 / DSM 22257 / CCUG 43843 / 130Z) TaxID=339671 RepID=A6VNY0_ACTSZ|nr:MFS transporter [Actinobacillus succinogenes]ABR74677.1 major facilitator superfamily MFS_1 [Actinobacillus succinogenes 130Z]PHI40901.1 MFS transporter [Actinobacillus succinogenes]